MMVDKQKSVPLAVREIVPSCINCAHRIYGTFHCSKHFVVVKNKVWNKKKKDFDIIKETVEAPIDDTDAKCPDWEQHNTTILNQKTFEALEVKRMGLGYRPLMTDTNGR